MFLISSYLFLTCFNSINTAVDNAYDTLHNAVNPSESEHKKEFKTFFNESYNTYDKDMFYVTNKIEMTEKNSTISILKNEIQHGILHLRRGINKYNVQKLLTLSERSAFGTGFKTQYNKKVRDGREIKAEYLKYDFNPTDDKILRESITKLLQGRNFILKMQKINIYNEGGKFKVHKDTVRSINQIATLVLLFPVNHRGGELKLKQNKTEIEMSLKKDQNYISWVCFFCDTDHEVSEVKDGTRITLTYDVILTEMINIYYFINGCGSYCDSNLKEQIMKFVRSLKNYCFQNKTYLGIFPFQCYNNYIVKYSGDVLFSHLKGLDYIFFDCLRECGYAPRMYQLYSKVFCDQKILGYGSQQSDCKKYYEDPRNFIKKGIISDRFIDYPSDSDYEPAKKKEKLLNMII